MIIFFWLAFFLQLIFEGSFQFALWNDNNFQDQVDFIGALSLSKVTETKNNSGEINFYILLVWLVARQEIVLYFIH